MFKTISYQEKILKNPGSCKYREDGKNVYFVFSHGAIAVPKSECMLDLTKLEKTEANIPSYFEIPEKYIPLESTGFMRRLDTMTVEQFAFGTTVYWLNSRLLTPFRKDYEYIASGELVLMRNIISGDVDAVMIKVAIK